MAILNTLVLAIGKAQNLMLNETLKNDLIFISVKFGDLALILKKYVHKLQYRNCRTSDKKNYDTQIGKYIQKGGVVKKNLGYIDFKTINDIKIDRPPLEKNPRYATYWYMVSEYSDRFTH